jgi:hypothetical protein
VDPSGCGRGHAAGPQGVTKVRGSMAPGPSGIRGFLRPGDGRLQRARARGADRRATVPLRWRLAGLACHRDVGTGDRPLASLTRVAPSRTPDDAAPGRVSGVSQAAYRSTDLHASSGAPTEVGRLRPTTTPRRARAATGGAQAALW